MEVSLKSYRFRRERESSWLELEALVEKADKKGMRSLTAEELGRLPVLYRSALSSLSVARNISLDQNVVEYLEGLASRAYFCVYGSRQRVRTAVLDFLLWRFPAAVRQTKWSLLIATLFMVSGAAVAFIMVAGNADRYYTFVDSEYAQGRDPSTSTEDLKAVLYDGGGEEGQSLAAFASFLFTHNAKIGILAFALGFLLGIPTFFLMFTNGLILGAFAALYHGRGLSVDLWGWLLPHGVTELLAVVLCGAAGLVLAQAIVFPGRMTRMRSLAARGRVAAQVVIGAVLLFLIAGLIEGIFRQTVQSVPIRYAVATSTAAFWILYFSLVGRAREKLEAKR